MKSENFSSVIKLLRDTPIGVVATVDRAGSPSCAVVAVTGLNDGRVVFATDRNTKKAKNVKSDNRVALVVGWDNLVTVQLEGVAHIATGRELNMARRAHLKQHPKSAVEAASGTETYFVFQPKWVRLSDFRTSDARIHIFSSDQFGLKVA